VFGYRHALSRLNITDDSVTLEDVEARLWEIDSPNSRRQAAIAVRAVLGLPVQIPKAIAKRYDLLDEDTLRLVLMQSKHETRGLLMMYAGIRLAEVCAITHKSLKGEHLIIDRQVIELRASTGITGGDRECIKRLGPTKSREDDVVIPAWLVPRVQAIVDTASPRAVRESIQYAARKVGVKVTPHELRHWYATESLRRGMSMKSVSRQLRHGDIATTMRTYAQADTEREVRDAWG
jgi:integrase